MHKESVQKKGNCTTNYLFNNIIKIKEFQKSGETVLYCLYVKIKAIIAEIIMVLMSHKMKLWKREIEIILRHQTSLSDNQFGFNLEGV